MSYVRTLRTWPKKTTPGDKVICFRSLITQDGILRWGGTRIFPGTVIKGMLAPVFFCFYHPGWFPAARVFHDCGPVLGTNHSFFRYFVPTVGLQP